MALAPKNVNGLKRQLDPAIFGGYDVRGKAMGRKKNLTPVQAYHIGRALGSRLEEGSVVFVARDGRLTSPALMEAIIDGYRDSGIHVIVNQDVCPTGITTWVVVQKSFQGSVMVSGSHNPKEDNGLKITEKGNALYGDALQELIPMIQNGNYRKPQTRGWLTMIDIRPAYEQTLKEQNSPLKTTRHIIFDAGNGIGGGAYPSLEEFVGVSARGTVQGINLIADGKFPAYGCADPSKPSCVDPVAKEIIKQNLKTIMSAKKVNRRTAAVMLKKVDELDQDLLENMVIGLIYDGDADRCGFIDETGAIVWPERMAAVFAVQYLRDLQRGILPDFAGNAMALDVRASSATAKMVKENGGAGWFIQAGYPSHRAWAQAIIPEIEKHLVTLFSAEASGHFFFPTALYGPNNQRFDHAAAKLIDDGIWASFQFLKILDSYERFTSLHGMMKALPSNPASREIRIDVDNARKFEIVEELTSMVRQQYADALLPLGRGVIQHEALRIQSPDEGLILVDGVRPQLKNGTSFTMRASNTSAKLTLNAESQTPSQLIKVLNELVKLINNFGSAADPSGIREEAKYQEGLLAA